MGLALGTVLGANLYLENREAAAALEAFQQEQALMADAAAAVVRSRLEVEPEAPVHRILRDLLPLERPRTLQVFLRPPGGAWLSLQGDPAPVAEGLIPRSQAPALGLPARMAAVGRASVLDPRGRAWALAVAGTASRERDRSQHARWRLNLSFLLTGGFLLVLIRWALLLQKRELDYARAMELQEMGRRKDEVLSQTSRAATVLTLASGVAHEISTPLGVISGRAAQLVTHLKDDERSTRLARTIQEEVDHISRTVRHFLDLARGGLPAAEDLEPAALLASAAAMVVHRFEKAGVTLDTQVPGGLPRLRGDARLLEHLLVNVLLNACDASTQGSRVELRARSGERGICLEVADQGKGIPEALVERVLEPFFTTKPQGKGTGLGLAIAQEIVRMHQGSLEFERAQPRGTRVLIWLPAV